MAGDEGEERGEKRMSLSEICHINNVVTKIYGRQNT